MQYIQKDMCDTSHVYKFDRSLINNKAVKEKNPDFLGGFRENWFHNSISEENPIMKRLKICDSKEREKHRHKHKKHSGTKDDRNLRKRDLKEKSKKIELVTNGGDNPKRRANSSELSSSKLFKIEKVSKNGTESVSISNSEGQKGSSWDNEQSVKLNKSPDKPSSQQKRAEKNIIFMNKGEIIIQGNQIVTSVPCKVEKLNNSVTTIIPTKNVKIIIEEHEPSEENTPIKKLIENPVKKSSKGTYFF